MKGAIQINLDFICFIDALFSNMHCCVCPVSPSTADNSQAFAFDSHLLENAEMS